MPKTRIRVCAVGREQDMMRLCRYLLRNDEEPLPGEATLDELKARILALADEEGMAGSQFLYEMIADRMYGDAREETCRLEIRQEACGLFTALFAYESDSLFQSSDWMAPHLACAMPFFVLRASEDLCREKGMLMLAGGKVRDNWDRMAEAWMYLTAGYGKGMSVREICRMYDALKRYAEDEDTVTPVEELPDACVENLLELQQFMGEPEEIRTEIEVCMKEKDFQGLFYFFGKAAETRLWDAEHGQEYIEQLRDLGGLWTIEEE